MTPPSSVSPIEAWRIAVVAVALSVLWLLWSGHRSLFMLSVEAVAILLVVVLSARMRTIDQESYPFEIAGEVLRYLPWIVWQIVLSNLAVSRMILRPNMRLKPVLVSIPANQATVIGRVIHANSITITPGTISLDVTETSILVHALHESMDPTDNLDARLCRLERSLR